MGLSGILVIVGTICGLLALIAILVQKQTTGSPLIAAILSVGFGAFTAVQISREGAETFWFNHSQNLTGVQVWWDLIFALMLTLFFVAPRARKVGMNVPLWAVLVVATASIGLLAMIARLFWLERASAE